jgi:hypothetical protein
LNLQKALELINEVKNAMTKLVDDKINDIEFNLNNKIVNNNEIITAYR